MKATRIISYWETLKDLIAQENIDTDEEIQMIDWFLYTSVQEEINEKYGKSIC